MNTQQYRQRALLIPFALFLLLAAGSFVWLLPLQLENATATRFQNSSRTARRNGSALVPSVSVPTEEHRFVPGECG